MERFNNSPSKPIYRLYNEFEKRGMDTYPISRAIQQVTGTVAKNNLEVVSDWIEELIDSKNYEPF